MMAEVAGKGCRVQPTMVEVVRKGCTVCNLCRWKCLERVAYNATYVGRSTW